MTSTKEKGRQPRQGLATCVFNSREERNYSAMSIPAGKHRTRAALAYRARIGQ